MITAHRRLKKAILDLRDKNTQILSHQNEIEKYSNEIDKAYQKLKELEEYRQAMINMIVHDLKSPLGVLSNIDAFGSEEEKRPVIDAISKQMMNLVLNMLDINKTETKGLILSKEKIVLSKIINSAIEDVEYFSNDKEIDLTNDVNKHIIINADSGIMLRIIVNLLINAIKFSYSNSKVEVLSVITTRNKLIVSVKDYGMGIAKEHHELIFERFKQIEKIKSGNDKSTGLGLAFCKMATEAHGWTIWVESEPGQGSEFKIEISDFILTEA